MVLSTAAALSQWRSVDPRDCTLLAGMSDIAACCTDVTTYLCPALLSVHWCELITRVEDFFVLAKRLIGSG